MAKIMLYDGEARAALARGVDKLSRAVVGTLGPKGTNAIIDRPIGTPLVSRDGVSIAAEIELPCRFENLGAQVVREVSMQTNEVAGDGTTTATALANALVQGGVPLVEDGHKAADVIAGIDRAHQALARELVDLARPVRQGELRMVANVASTQEALGALIAEAVERVGPEGVINVEYGLPGTPTRLDVDEGVVLDRGFVSHHMATDASSLAADLGDAAILLTDNKVLSAEPVLRLLAALRASGRPLLLVADEISPEAIAAIMQARAQGHGTVVAINPPEFGHWRKAMMEDLGIMTGARVIARDLGGRIEDATVGDLGSAAHVHITASATVIRGAQGDEDAIAGRRRLVKQLWDEAPQNIERDKYAERLAKLTRGTAVLLAGGATPVEQKRTAQLLDDGLNATRAARDEGVVPGGGTALAQLSRLLQSLVDEHEGGVRAGIALVQEAVRQPLAIIARNAGRDSDQVVAQVVDAESGIGFDARSGVFGDTFAAGVIDPVRVTLAALANAVSVAKLILTTHSLVVDLPEDFDPTAGPARGGGAEVYGRA
ncbi:MULTISPECIES: chaperonin GroEL [unclassified Novosphingobium]|uniref:chaperonin GroEL n=1 Tax=unclassified Novosphingobium TaxID=2644732 RepID=UPI0008695E67|nr:MULTISPECIES: chaperonin GroEL [unclassified Novosphingobium]MDR6708664.1 chaperonin GroEL [Novosphingobium sp. 1748]ODU81985.1 MAG: molecular chaperone GroEL [Novosphingobium sp. SCN 63-17]OJX96709.1 MAG: molecular chaperone GroEL [Novosphingobium sp. 63-713]